MTNWKRAIPAIALALAILAVAPVRHAAADYDDKEAECIAAGWQRATVTAGGIERKLLWKAPSGPWTRGAIIAMHGGSGFAPNFCSVSAAYGTTTQPMVDFSNLAIAAGFAVFSLDSTNLTTDNTGLVCGKCWDDEVRQRDNLDLPFIEEVITEIIPQRRPQDSSPLVFMTGISSGGLMTMRASTHFDNLVAAFAPVSAGDPYGWHRVCDHNYSHGYTEDTMVWGYGLDNETGRGIQSAGSCDAPSYPNDKPWETADPAEKPSFKMLHHQDDGSMDYSCHLKGTAQLTAHGYADAGSYVIPGEGTKTVLEHMWQSEYNQPIIDFFSGVQAQATAVGGVVEAQPQQDDSGDSGFDARWLALGAIGIALMAWGMWQSVKRSRNTRRRK